MPELNWLTIIVAAVAVFAVSAVQLVTLWP